MAILLKFPKDIVLEGEYIIMKPEVTEKEFWELANEDSNYELINGVLIIHSPASEEHEDIFSYFNSILRFYLEEKGIGKVYGSRFVMRLSPQWNPEPDLMIITTENYKRISTTRIEGPADIVIEILSKATKEIDLTKKIPKYLEAGVKEVWVIDPMEKSIKILTAQKELVWIDSLSDDYLKSEILLDLKFKVKWIWNREKYPSNTIIKRLFQ